MFALLVEDSIGSGYPTSTYLMFVSPFEVKKDDVGISDTHTLFNYWQLLPFAGITLFKFRGYFLRLCQNKLHSITSYYEVTYEFR